MKKKYFLEEDFFEHVLKTLREEDEEMKKIMEELDELYYKGQEEQKNEQQMVTTPKEEIDLDRIRELAKQEAKKLKPKRKRSKKEIAKAMLPFLRKARKLGYSYKGISSLVEKHFRLKISEKLIREVLNEDRDGNRT